MVGDPLDRSPPGSLWSERLHLAVCLNHSIRPMNESLVMRDFFYSYAT